jgi:hypothetical protein
MIDTVYLTTKNGTDLMVAEEAKEILEEIRQDIRDKRAGDDADYIFYANGTPVYWAKKYSAISPMTFPKPDKYGMTSRELYSLADTLPKSIAKLEQLRSQPKPSLISQLKEVGMLIMPLTVAIVVAGLIILTASGA